MEARRGSFPLLPEVGSRLYLLPREKASARQALGASYAAEALAGEKDLQVTGALWEESQQRLTVFLQWKGEALEAQVGV